MSIGLFGKKRHQERMQENLYPYDEGGVTVLGPEIFASEDGEVINWQGRNYIPQEYLAKDLLVELDWNVRVTELP